MRLRASGAGVGLLVMLGLGCGGRSELAEGSASGTKPAVACKLDADCRSANLCLPQICSSKGKCIAAPAIECDDKNLCTRDSCEPSSGSCFRENLAEDRDRDGVLGVPFGTSSDIAAACANDCDDTSAAVQPGARETCDGKDNDCNGIIDDGAVWAPNGQSPLQVSFGQERAQASGIAFDGQQFALSYAGKKDNWKIYFQGISPDARLAAQVPLTSVNADTFGGPLLWTGSAYAVAWEDARIDDNYEIYFNRLDRSGQKFGPDLRITRAEDFSLHPALVYSDGEYLLAWDDRRSQLGAAPGSVVIYGQRVSEGGELIGSNVPLTLPESGSESPSLARGKAKVGMVYTSLVGGAPILNFRSLSPDLSQLGPIVDVGFSDVQAPSIIWLKDRFLVFWDHFREAPGSSIWGAALAEDGTVLVSPRAVTDYGQFARSHVAVSLGDRALLVWSDFRYSNYELESKQISPSLLGLTPETRLTTSPNETLSPHVAIGPTGAVGILYEDWLTGTRQVYFTQLLCQNSVPSL